jgi:hypothetical protein
MRIIQRLISCLRLDEWFPTFVCNFRNMPQENVPELCRRWGRRDIYEVPISGDFQCRRRTT